VGHFSLRIVVVHEHNKLMHPPLQGSPNPIPQIDNQFLA
jgi:hypothetical protein